MIPFASSMRLSITSQIVKRRFATLPDSAAVSLAYDIHPAISSVSSNTSSLSPIVILHGLFGSKQNWRSLSKALAQKTERTIFALVCEN